MKEEDNAEPQTKMQVKWRDKLQPNVLELVRAGYTAKKISETTGVPRSTVRGWADEAGLRVKSAHKGYSPEMKAKVLELVRTG
ncbi:MAG: helix-turn-helix domain-containing protein, partial [Puniceicoccales bacterium]|nr:helix-turn-helix domain-containing protein [Puniceicoccales bacterium]